MKFCDKLQKIRKDNNITQEQLADKLNVSRQAVSKWESGTAFPDTEKLIQISRIFKVSLDDLVNDNNDTSKINTNGKKFNFMETFNIAFEFVHKLFSMFFAMKFWEKIKFLIEMALLLLAIYICAIISTNIIVELFRRIFMFMPHNIIRGITYLVDTLLYIIWIVLGCIIFIKVLKIRYLDYYVVITDDSVKERVVEEPIKELKEKKEYKVVIRDPEHSSLNLIKRIGHLFMIIVKFFAVFIAIPVVFGFIFFVVLFVISLAYSFSGIFFNGISLAILGVIAFIYLVIEFLYNLVFNRKNAYSKMFLIFIISISLIGIGIGISFSTLSTFDTYNEKYELDNKQTYTIKMEDNLIIPDIVNIPNEKIVIDNDLSDIKMDIISCGNCRVGTYSYNTYDFDDDMIYNSFEVVSTYVDYDVLEVYRSIINDLKNKKINTYNLYNGYGNNYEIEKLYISESNLTRIRENFTKIYD